TLVGPSQVPRFAWGQVLLGWGQGSNLLGFALLGPDPEFDLQQTPVIQNLSTPELAYCLAVLLFTFALRGSLGFGGAVGLPLLALVIPVKILAPAWSLVGIVSSAAIIGRDRRHVARRAFLRLLPGCALGIAAGLFLFKS